MKPLQFGIRSLIAFSLFTAAVFGLAQWLHFSFQMATFICGFIGLCTLLAGLMGVSQRSLHTVKTFQTLESANMVLEYLRENGVRATLHGGDSSALASASWSSQWKIVVPQEQQEQAESLLAQSPHDA